MQHDGKAQNAKDPSVAGAPPRPPDPTEGAYSAPANPIVGGKGLAVPSSRTPSPLSALGASPFIPPLQN